MQADQQVSLGKTKLKTTRLGLGTAPIGGLYNPVAVADAHALIRRAAELGLRLFDTAPLYGLGQSERWVGDVVSTLPRDSFILSTKVGRLLRSDAPPDPTQLHDGEPAFKGAPPLAAVFDFSYDGVMRSVEESLQRLRLDRVDILHIHDPDLHYNAAISGAYRALDQLRSEGTIRAVGAGMNQAEMLTQFARDGDFDCFLVAGRYTLLDHSALTELLPLCAQKNIAILIGGVYNSGILADPREGAPFNYRPAATEWVARAQHLKIVCDRYHVPLMAAAIQFPLAHPAVATVLTGARSVAELEENAKMLSWDIPPALWQDMRAEGLIPSEAPIPGE